VQKLQKNKLNLLLSVLPEPHSSKLRMALKETSEPVTFSEPMRSFIFNQLYPEIKLKDVLPIEYLPLTDMNELAHFKKNGIVDLIDFLGLYDLSEEVRRIVDKKIVENIYKCLTRKKHQFLRGCLHQKGKLVTQSIRLEHWDGNCQKLAKILHHRGMIRLGYALSGQHPDLLWHITHLLDTGRGEKLSRYYHKEEIPGVTEALKLQVKSIVKFLKKMEKK